jgi:hypothetical protein
MIGRLLCALGFISVARYVKWIGTAPAETARLRLAWVVGHDRAATGDRHDVSAPGSVGFWTGVQDGLRTMVRQFHAQRTP